MPETNQKTSVFNTPRSTSVKTPVGPGGCLVWVSKKTDGESHVNGCRLHQTVEYSLTDVPNPVPSQVDSYDPTSKMYAVDGYFPFGSSASVYVNYNKEPKIFCISNGITMFDSDNLEIEEKNLKVDLYEIPTRLLVTGVGNHTVGACITMSNGDVFFKKTYEEADLSSSSSSSSSMSSMSSSSSGSSSSSSSSSSTVLRTSSSSSSLSSSSSSTIERSTSSYSSQSQTTLSSGSSLSTLSSSSSASWLCNWDLIEVVDEEFRDMDRILGGIGTVRNEFTDINITGLNQFNTDACNTIWCIYVPCGTYGVGGSASGQVYLYKSSSRPSGPPYNNSALVGAFPLDQSSLYGFGYPKTLPVSSMNNSGIGGTVKWSGGLGYSGLLPGCDDYRLQIPFKLRKEESSSSSSSSSSSRSSSSNSSSSSSTSLSSQSICGCIFKDDANTAVFTFIVGNDDYLSKSIIPNCILYATVDHAFWTRTSGSSGSSGGFDLITSITVRFNSFTGPIVATGGGGRFIPSFAAMSTYPQTYYLRGESNGPFDSNDVLIQAVVPPPPPNSLQNQTVNLILYAHYGPCAPYPY